MHLDRFITGGSVFLPIFQPINVTYLLIYMYYGIDCYKLQVSLVSTVCVHSIEIVYCLLYSLHVNIVTEYC